MSDDEDIDLEEVEVDDPEIDNLDEDATPSSQADSRRRLEDRLEEARLRKLMDDYDFDD